MRIAYNGNLKKSNAARKSIPPYSRHKNLLFKSKLESRSNPLHLKGLIGKSIFSSLAF
jgi:hypothetical protein